MTSHPLLVVQEDWRVNDGSPFVWPELSEVIEKEESVSAKDNEPMPRLDQPDVLKWEVAGGYVVAVARVGKVYMPLNRLGWKWRVLDGDREIAHGGVGGTSRFAHWRAERLAKRAVSRNLAAREHLGCWPIDADHPVKKP